MELIISERSEGTYGAPALQGFLTASVVGPKPVPLEWILQAVLSPPESEEIGFDRFPEFNWVVEKTEELFFRIARVFCGGSRAVPVAGLHAKTEGGRHHSCPANLVQRFRRSDDVLPGRLGAVHRNGSGISSGRSDHHDFRSRRMG